MQTRCCLLQETMHHLKIGLKVIPLRPLIPGIDEHQRLWQLVEGLLISKDGAQPVAVGGWCGAVEDVGAAMPAAEMRKARSRSIAVPPADLRARPQRPSVRRNMPVKLRCTAIAN
jgi:hypothetical protein